MIYGKVRFSNYNDGGYGHLVIIRHFNGLETYYAHLNKFHRNIKVGQKVRAFETIGYVGSTGHSTGPHLHFEYRPNSQAVDPLTAKLSAKAAVPHKDVEKLFYF